MENFPNLKPETLEKLSTVEGIKNREEILNSLSDEELGTGISFSELEKTNSEKVRKIIEESKNLDSEAVMDRLQMEFPRLHRSDDSYRESFMKEIDKIINEAETEEERSAITKQYLKVDLLELQKTGGTSDIKAIRNVIRENYTHHNLLKGIKSRSNLSNNETQSSIDETQSSTEQLNNTMDLFE
jgi:hypothetical protein